jgi:hypothetical protein
MIANYFQEKLMFQEQCELSLRAIDRALGLHSLFPVARLVNSLKGVSITSANIRPFLSQPSGQNGAPPRAKGRSLRAGRV